MARKQYKNGSVKEQKLEERIFGIYATFVFCYAQPVDYVSRIRITPSEIADIQHLFTSVHLPSRYFEANAFSFKLFQDNAFMVTTSRKRFDLSQPHLVDEVDFEEPFDDKGKQYVPSEAVEEIMESSVLKAMRIVHQQMLRKQSLLPLDLALVEMKNNILDKIDHEFDQASCCRGVP
ncbi:hypothetical protein DICVIV_13853, partial [Dictyocaulus viviparus]